MNTIDDISLDDLVILENLSVRAKNVCVLANLTSLKLIINFYSTKKSFMRLHNCGALTDLELINICKKYQTTYYPTNNDAISLNNAAFPQLEVLFNNEFIILEKLNSLNSLQTSLFSTYFKQLLSNLHSKTYNTLSRSVNINDDQQIIEALFTNRINIKHADENSINQINEFKLSLKNYIDFLQTSTRKQLIKEYIRTLLNKNINNKQNNIELEIEKVFDTNDKIKLFALLHLIIYNSKIISDNRSLIFLQLFSNENKNKLTNLSISQSLHVSGERVRQIKNKFKKEIKYYFKNILDNLFIDIINYNIELKPVNVIEYNYIEKINKDENVKFNIKFYSAVFCMLLNKIDSDWIFYEIIYGKNKIKDNFKYQDSYLIKKTLFNCFDFDRFIKAVYIRINAKVKKAYEINLSKFLQSFIKSENYLFFDEIQHICKSIILNEFNLNVNQEGNLIIEKNIAKLKLYDYCFDILEEAGDLLSVQQIYESIKLRLPNKNLKLNTIRASLLKEKEIFINFGKSGTYGLKKWEDNNSKMKGGTIRNIVEEYLNKSKSPKHISEIFKHVSKYRNTNAINILSNLKSDNNNRFITLKDGNIGLANQQYPKDSIIIKQKRKVWYKRFKDLEDFFKNNNNKMPKYNSTDKNERSLYTFSYITRKAYNTNSLDKDKVELLKSINFPFNILYKIEKT